MLFQYPPGFVSHKGKVYRKITEELWRPATPEQAAIITKMMEAHANDWPGLFHELYVELKALPDPK